MSLRFPARRCCRSGRRPPASWRRRRRSRPRSWAWSPRRARTWTWPRRGRHRRRPCRGRRCPVRWPWSRPRCRGTTGRPGRRCAGSRPCPTRPCVPSWHCWVSRTRWGPPRPVGASSEQCAACPGSRAPGRGPATAAARDRRRTGARGVETHGVRGHQAAAGRGRPRRVRGVRAGAAAPRALVVLLVPQSCAIGLTPVIDPENKALTRSRARKSRTAVSRTCVRLRPRSERGHNGSHQHRGEPRWPSTCC